MSKLYDHFVQLPAGPVTQGDIYTCAPPLPEPIGHSSAIVITPKCDLAHSKATIVNYLAVVPVSRYLQQFGTPVALARMLAKAHAQLESALMQAKCPQIALLNLPPAEVSDLLGSVEFKSIKNRRAIEEQLENCVYLNAALEGRGIHAKIEPLFQKERAKLIRDLMKNSIADAHFLPASPPVAEEGSVVLLRFIGTCPISFFRAAGSVTSEAQWKHLCAERASIYYSCPQKPEPLLRLTSPFLESMMQRCVALFSRVGVHDLDPDTLEMTVAALESTL